MDEQKQTASLLHYKLSPGNGFAIGLLMLALIALGERVLYDLARIFASPPLDYFNNLNVIVVHAFFIIPLLIISIVINMLVGSKKAKYAIALIPYFVLSIVLALQLAFQVSIYFAFHHTQIQFYIVMTLLVVITTAAIYYIQDRYSGNS